VAQPQLLSPVKMLADNLNYLPEPSREFARSLIADAVRRDLSDRQLLQVAKLIQRVRKEKARLGNGTPEPPRPGADGSKTVARRTTDWVPRDAAKPKRSPKDRCAAAGARSAS
jgi:hypothetical protein